MANPKTGCHCGSGAHPRECPIHPELYRLHIAQLNLESYLPEDGEDAGAAGRAALALEQAIWEALRVARIPPIRCAYSPLAPEDNPGVARRTLTSPAVTTEVRFVRNIVVDAPNP